MESHEEKLRRLFGTEEFNRLCGVVGRVPDDEDFVERLLLQDIVDDWQVALELGQYWVLVYPDLLVGHVIVARASRHLGACSQAAGALRDCQELVRRGAA